MKLQFYYLKNVISQIFKVDSKYLTQKGYNEFPRLIKLTYSLNIPIISAFVYLAILGFLIIILKMNDITVL